MVKMDLLDDAVRVLSYDERAALLATAITIDNDYFSRHSRGGYAFRHGLRERHLTVY